VHDFGSAVAVDGTVAVVGAWNTTKGYAYIYNQSGGMWAPTALPMSGGLGAAVAVRGRPVAVSSVSASGNHGVVYALLQFRDTTPPRSCPPARRAGTSSATGRSASRAPHSS